MDGTHPQTAGSVCKGQSFFAGFTFSGDQSVDALTGFYGLEVSALQLRMTLAEYFMRVCRSGPRPGYRVALGRCAELVALEIEEGIVTRVGLRLPSSPRYPTTRHYFDEFNTAKFVGPLYTPSTQASAPPS